MGAFGVGGVLLILVKNVVIFWYLWGCWVFVGGCLGFRFVGFGVVEGNKVLIKVRCLLLLVPMLAHLSRISPCFLLPRRPLAVVGFEYYVKLCVYLRLFVWL